MRATLFGVLSMLGGFFLLDGLAIVVLENAVGGAHDSTGAIFVIGSLVILGALAANRLLRHHQDVALTAAAVTATALLAILLIG